jgi:hypothetical protein
MDIDNPLLKGTKERHVAMTGSNIDLSLGNVFTKTLTEATTLTVSNVPASGIVASFILELTDGGLNSVTWWSGIKWPNGTAPNLSLLGTDCLSFYTYDGGTNWRGFLMGASIA